MSQQHRTRKEPLPDQLMLFLHAHPQDPVPRSSSLTPPSSGTASLKLATAPSLACFESELRDTCNTPTVIALFIVFYEFLSLGCLQYSKLGCWRAMAMLPGAQPQGTLHFLHWPSLRLQKNTVGISLLLQFTDRNKASWLGLFTSFYLCVFSVS